MSSDSPAGWLGLVTDLMMGLSSEQSSRVLFLLPCSESRCSTAMLRKGKRSGEAAPFHDFKTMAVGRVRCLSPVPPCWRSSAGAEPPPERVGFEVSVSVDLAGERTLPRSSSAFFILQHHRRDSCALSSGDAARAGRDGPLILHGETYCVVAARA